MHQGFGRWRAFRSAGPGGRGVITRAPSDQLPCGRPAQRLSWIGNWPSRQLWHPADHLLSRRAAQTLAVLISRPAPWPCQAACRRLSATFAVRGAFRLAERPPQRLPHSQPRVRHPCARATREPCRTGCRPKFCNRRLLKPKGGRRHARTKSLTACHSSACRHWLGEPALSSPSPHSPTMNSRRPIFHTNM